MISISLLGFWAAPTLASESDARFRLLGPEEQKLVMQLADVTIKAYPQSNREDAVNAWILQLEQVRAPFSLSMQKTMNDHMLTDFFDVRSGPNSADADGFLRVASRIASEELGGVAEAYNLKGAALKTIYTRANAFYRARRKAYDDLDSGGRVAAEFQRQGKTMEIIFFSNQLQAWSFRMKKFALSIQAIRDRIPDRFPGNLKAKLEQLNGEIKELDIKVTQNIARIQGTLKERATQAKKLGLVPIEYNPNFRDFEVQVIPGGIGKHFEFLIVNETIWAACAHAVVN